MPIVCLTHSFVVAKKPGSKEKNGEVMDEDRIWSQSPATRHSAASTKAHCKQVCVFSLIHNFPLKHFKF